MVCDRLAIVTDEISRDFSEAIDIGLEWGVRNYELRGCRSGRVPQISDQDKKTVQETIKNKDVSINVLSPGVFKVPIGSAEAENERRVVLPATYELANELEVSHIIVFGFRKEGSGSLPKQRIADVFNEELEKAKKYGITLLLENEHICWIDTAPAVLEVAEQIDADNWGITWDPGNAFSAGGDPVLTGYNSIKEFVKNVHIKDVVISESGREWVPVGDGDIDWETQIQSLMRDEYSGFYTVETHCQPKIQNSQKSISVLKGYLKACA